MLIYFFFPENQAKNQADERATVKHLPQYGAREVHAPCLNKRAEGVGVFKSMVAIRLIKQHRSSVAILNSGGTRPTLFIVWIMAQQKLCGNGVRQSFCLFDRF